MSTPLITNFKINVSHPIDDRIVASNSNSRINIQYKYDGLKVFQTDVRTTYTYNLNLDSWVADETGDGIYSGSGSLVSNTTIDIGTISSSVNSNSNILSYSSTVGSNKVYLNNFLYRGTTGSDWVGTSYRTQLKVDTINMSYIEWNPDHSNLGGFAIGTGLVPTEKLRINSDGKVGILMLPYSYSSLIVRGIISSNGLYVNSNNINSATVSGGYIMNVDNIGNLQILDTSPYSADYRSNLVGSSISGYVVLNIKSGKILIGGVTSSTTAILPESRLEVYDNTTLGITTGNNVLLKTLTHANNNIYRIREWVLRDHTFSAVNDWQSNRYHNGISVDSSFGTPGINTRTFWERDPYTEKQWFGSSTNKTLEINSASSSVGIGNDFLFYNKEKISYIDSNSYVVDGNAQVVQSSRGSYSGGNGYIKDLIVPNDCTISIEVNFNSAGDYSPTFVTGSVTKYISNTVNIYTYKVNASGVITQVGNTSLHNFTDSYILQAGNIVTSTNNTLKLRHEWIIPGIISGYYVTVGLKVNYKMFISKY